ncbi:MAG: hypothetical protein M1814_003699 [Vezdaea aestivalis]|nr:MAG: hypothetical protein M1814_003699 [Vezdaea aestivalis]
MPLRIRPRLPKPSISHSNTIRSSSALAHAPSLSDQSPPPSMIKQYPPNQPPSYKPADLRKSQLIRQYTSLILSSPLILLFQQNSLIATEWAAVRRELNLALQKASSNLSTPSPDLASAIKIQTLQTGLFSTAMRLVEFYYPTLEAGPTPTPTSRALSAEANAQVRRKKLRGGMQQLVAGPMAAVVFPAIEPALVKATLQILAPKAPHFPAPKKRASPGYHDPSCQRGIQKLVFLGARAEGRVYDPDQARRIGGLRDFDGVRAELKGTLEGVAGGLVGNLEGIGTGLWTTLEGRRMMLEEEGKEETDKVAA